MVHRWFVIPAVLGMIVAGFFLVRSLDDDLVYYFYTSEAVERRTDFPDGRVFRLAGHIVAGTLTATDEGYEFSLSDGEATVDVLLVSTPPPLFAEDVEVLLDGAWRGERFVADSALIRHAEDYRAPESGTDVRGPGAAPI